MYAPATTPRSAIDHAPFSREHRSSVITGATPVKIVHFADLHIGVENYSRPDPETGLPSRLLDFLQAFDELVEFSLAENVDLVLFAGDAYKSREPSQTQQREFAKRVQRLASAGIPV